MTWTGVNALLRFNTKDYKEIHASKRTFITCERNLMSQLPAGACKLSLGHVQTQT